jgi:hypothetical protein
MLLGVVTGEFTALFEHVIDLRVALKAGNFLNDFNYHFLIK